MTTPDLKSLTAEQIAEIRTALQREEDFRKEAATLRQAYEATLAKIAQLAQDRGPVPFDPVPEAGHLPGQVVEHFGQLYENVSHCYLVEPPTQHDGWKHQGLVRGLVPELEAPVTPIVPDDPVEDSEPEDDGGE